MKLTQFDVFDCLFSGGRDSALACYIASRVAKRLGKKFRLVHIDTRISIPDTKEYIQQYANWLGVELVTIRTTYDYFEYVRKWGYPSILKNRWCWRYLKQEPLYQFRISELKEGVNSVWIAGIRKTESLLRLQTYGNLKNTLVHGTVKNLHTVNWFPIFYLTGSQVEQLIREFRIPKNPVWEKVGISGDCLCFAAASRKVLEAVFTNYPEIAQKFYEFDKSLVSPHGKGEPIVLGLWSERKRLYQFIEEIRKKGRQTTLTEYMSCQGGCFV